MKNTRIIMPSHLREVCSAVCAIVHANINENSLFKQSVSRKRTRISSLRKQSFSDNGVIVELDQGMINVKIHVSAMVSELPIIQNVLVLQRSIAEEILLLTSFNPKRIDFIITGIHDVT
jgi:hypothetical protein